ncbi:MAG: nuclear transport factor 2 family protein [bacterium]
MNNLQTVQSIYEDFGQGNIPAIIDRLADDIAWELPGTGHGIPWLEPGVGKQHVGSFFQAIGALEFVKFAPVNLLEGGNQVVAIIEVELIVKATGNSIKDYELHVWSFAPDGKVASFQHVLDTAGHLAAYRGQAVPA